MSANTSSHTHKPKYKLLHIPPLDPHFFLHVHFDRQDYIFQNGCHSGPTHFTFPLQLGFATALQFLSLRLLQTMNLVPSKTSSTILPLDFSNSAAAMPRDSRTRTTERYVFVHNHPTRHSSTLHPPTTKLCHKFQNIKVFVRNHCKPSRSQTLN